MMNTPNTKDLVPMLRGLRDNANVCKTFASNHDKLNRLDTLIDRKLSEELNGNFLFEIVLEAEFLRNVREISADNGGANDDLIKGAAYLACFRDCPDMILGFRGVNYLHKQITWDDEEFSLAIKGLLMASLPHITDVNGSRSTDNADDKKP